MRSERFSTAIKNMRQIRQDAVEYFRESPVELLSLPLTRKQRLAREAHMMDVANLREYGDNNLITVPSAGDHYDGWGFKWDGYDAAYINAWRDKPDQAAKELLTMEKYRDPHTGFLSNKFRLNGVEAGDRPYLEPERKLYNNRDFSGYGQPSLPPWATLATYESYLRQGRDEEAKQFLKTMYGTAEPGNYTGLQGECAYFLNHRQTSKDNPLVFNVHPNETGRDYDSALGPKRVTIPGKGKTVGFINTAVIWTRMNGVPKLREKIKPLRGFNMKIAELGHDPDGKRLDWLPEKVREKYAVNDVMFNALHAVSLHETAQVARKLAELADNPEERARYEEEANSYDTHAEKVETAILSLMSHEQKPLRQAQGLRQLFQRKDRKETFFYNIDKDGKQIPVKSITGLFPLLLDTIKPGQVELLIDRMEDPEWFGRPYPLPSHPKISKYYDPHYRRKQGPDWEGPVWINMNHYLVEEGLVKQAERFMESNPQLAKRCMSTAEQIVKKTEELLSINEKTGEHYNPEKGSRQRVPDFTWSNLGNHFEKFYKTKEKYTGFPPARE